jgi:phosphohistidine phosphatase
MGEILAKRGLVPELVLCSPATRARRTLELASPHWKPSAAIRIVRELYGANGSDYLGVIRTEGGVAARLMLVGHNPAMERTAEALVGTGGADAVARMTGKFPTAAVAVIDFAIEAWADLEPATGTLIDFLTPGGPGD